MEQNSVMRNADRYQMGMQIAGTPQTVDVNDLQAITTKLENVIIDFKDVVKLVNQLKDNPVITKDKKEFLQQINKNIKNIISDTMQTVKILDNVVE